MHLYKKIQKSKNVTYYMCANRENSKEYMILCDFSKSKYRTCPLIEHNPYEVTVAWVNKHTKSISWDAETEHMIDKDIIRNAVVIIV